MSAFKMTKMLCATLMALSLPAIGMAQAVVVDSPRQIQVGTTPAAPSDQQIAGTPAVLSQESNAMQPLKVNTGNSVWLHKYLQGWLTNPNSPYYNPNYNDNNEDGPQPVVNE